MPFTDIENCIIKPHERYKVKENYPSKVILCHHQSYLKAARELAETNPNLKIIDDWPHAREFRMLLNYKGIPIILDNPRDNAEETATHVIEHYFWAEKPLQVINVSSAGALKMDLAIGDASIGTQAVRDNRSVHNLADNSEAAASSSLITTALESSPLKRQGVQVSRGDV